jgi:hypothetical protein
MKGKICIHLTGQVVAAYVQVRLTPQDLGAPAGGISQSSTCICLPAEASAQAGAFLISLGKKSFSTDSNDLDGYPSHNSE